MEIGRIAGANKRFGAPANWDKDKNGACGTLPVRMEVIDDLVFLSSAWLPTPDEIAKLSAGAPVILSINGVEQPVVMMGVGEPPEVQSFLAQAEMRRARAERLFNLWQQDASAFSNEMPGLIVPIQGGVDPRTAALNAIAAKCFEGTRVTWCVEEAVGAVPHLVITGYDGTKS